MDQFTSSVTCTVFYLRVPDGSAFFPSFCDFNLSVDPDNRRRINLLIAKILYVALPSNRKPAKVIAGNIYRCLWCCGLPTKPNPSVAFFVQRTLPYSTQPLCLQPSLLAHTNLHPPALSISFLLPFPSPLFQPGPTEGVVGSEQHAISVKINTHFGRDFYLQLAVQNLVGKTVLFVWLEPHAANAATKLTIPSAVLVVANVSVTGGFKKVVLVLTPGYNN